MDFQVAYAPKKGTGRPLPKRGQIKAKIVGNFIRSVVTMASKAGKKSKISRSGSGSSLQTTPSFSSYASDGHSDS
ncbi:hypothetical protein MRB53_011256 [Persea americana]|uniref:Uncharacterized protein n=1 Tax=Persea americana TaxID=3435 RepID=A0ACC2LVC2_PERAE|nr:hypothetical protein MRB53_011256 [Persea americana]